MKKFNKVLALLLAMVMMLSLAACSSEPAEEESMDLVKETTVAPAETEASAVEEAEVSVEQIVADYFANKPDHSYMTKSADIISRVAAGDDVVILDIRQPDVYGEGHLKGAINVPWGPAIAENLNKISQDKEVFIYCYSGQTAGQAVMTLNAAGINARSIAYGWNFGLSKAEGIAAVTETTVNDFDGTTYEVAADVQSALDGYYTGLADVKETTWKNYKVSEANLKAMIENGDDFTLISARKATDFAEAHIKGAVNIPYGTSFITNLASVPMDKKVVVYCYSGQTAGQATAAMKLLGYDAVSLNGGMGTGASAPNGWTNKGYTVESASVVYNGVVNYFANKPDHSYMTKSADIIARVAAGDDVVILDIRQPDVYGEGHLKGAVNLPWGTAISENLSMIPQDKEVFIYCYSGQTAGQAVMTLNLAGINARSVSYGWNFGLSKAEGIADVTETTVNTLTEDVSTIDPEVQEALTAYYVGLADAKETKWKNYKVSEANLATMIEMEEDFTLISARKPDAFAEGHIAGAINIPYGNAFIESLGAVPMDKKVVVYCYSGQTAGQATAALKLLGYDAVSLNGGMGTEASNPNGWTNKGFEKVTD